MQAELEMIQRRKAELETRYSAAKAGGAETAQIEAEAQQILAYEQAVLSKQQDERATILCCSCGVPVQANETRLCLTCLEQRGGVAEEISETNTVNYCKSCQRYESKNQWLMCEWESKELLALCLKRIRKPKDVRLVEASFIWTESHSRRIKVQIGVEREIDNVTIRQKKIVTFVVTTRQCDECTKSVTPHIWVSNVQVRQRAGVKRTMLFLEQLILKYEMHKNCNNIVDTPDGLDFQFSKPQHAQALVQFIRQHICCRVAPTATQLVSHDAKSNVFRNKYTTIIELCPINRNDLVYIPKKIASHLGGVPSLMICDRVSSGIRLVDPIGLRNVDLDGERYFKLGFQSLSSRMVEFMVLDAQPVDPSKIATAGIAGRFLQGMANKYAPTAGPLSRQSNAQIPSQLGNNGALDQLIQDQQMQGLTQAQDEVSVTSTVRTSAVRGRNNMVLAEVELCKCSDLGVNERYVRTISHLGAYLKSGDIVLGYDLATNNFSDSDGALNEVLRNFPYEVMVVKKQSHKKVKQWEFQNLPKDIRTRKCSEHEIAQAEQDIDDLAQELQALQV
ncbi:NMD3 family protein [Gregarina niphandrodes]|uniref:60S ribosomal export protein NMD3 n=1 Tax=Gregarina niphandrodes TaxID=110365 RepID=A0A023B6D8_GRENI|nr:NMD3 family protein [Gregarina niphandrodes]EZG65867.1 NMD3 family protein [Gregarina niphandrodes]|eukprot:XP_011134053.1 NMD3 family protein [Gregarina niphandrodes]